MDPIWRNLIASLVAVGVGLVPQLLEKIDDKPTTPRRRRKSDSQPSSPVSSPLLTKAEEQAEINARLREEVERLKTALHQPHPIQ